MDGAVANEWQALGYTHREIFSGLFVLAALWPFFYGSRFISENRLLIFTWIAACLAMSTFTLLPVVKVEDITQMYALALSLP